MEKHEYEEFLTPEELIKLYDLEEGEDLREFVRKINSLSKGKRIILIEESQGSDSKVNLHLKCNIIL